MIVKFSRGGKWAMINSRMPLGWVAVVEPPSGEIRTPLAVQTVRRYPRSERLDTRRVTTKMARAPVIDRADTTTETRE
jgi:hypothetical protein